MVQNRGFDWTEIEQMSGSRRIEPTHINRTPDRLASVLVGLVCVVTLNGCTTKKPGPLLPLVSVFTNRTETAGITYKWDEPTRLGPRNIKETLGRGCAFLDYNNDGNLDVLLVGPSCALYKGDGRGAFQDVSAETRIRDLIGEYSGCSVADSDNDGYSDIYLSGYKTGQLLHNNHGTNFTNVSARSRIPTQTYGTSSAWADIDGDGKVDLYVGNYVTFNATSLQLCKRGKVMTSCPPGVYKGVPGRLYHNLGQHVFQDVTVDWKANAVPGKTLGAAFAPLSPKTMFPSLALANDEVPGELFLNTGKVFQSAGQTSGIAFSSVGTPQAGMGLDWGDFDNDGRFDLTVMTFSTETKPIYHNDGNGLYTDFAARLGAAHHEVPLVAFGVKWLDIDNDGWLDLLMTNGHTADNIAETGSGETYRQNSVLLRNQKGQQFQRLHSPSLDTSIVGRGLATGDYDNDGRVDALIVDNVGKPLLLQNTNGQTGHWIGLKLVGMKSNKDGYGAVITLQAGDQTLTRHCHSDGSFLSSSDPRVHFGLGNAQSVTSCTVRWPSGMVQRVKITKVDQYITVVEHP